MTAALLALLSAPFIQTILALCVLAVLAAWAVDRDRGRPRCTCLRGLPPLHTGYRPQPACPLHPRTTTAPPRPQGVDSQP